jgi:hypothetical protein
MLHKPLETDISIEKRTIHMRYTPPTITNILAATAAVQSVGLPDNEKHSGSISDVPPSTTACTLAAYEGDE